MLSSSALLLLLSSIVVVVNSFSIVPQHSPQKILGSRVCSTPTTIQAVEEDVAPAADPVAAEAEPAEEAAADSAAAASEEGGGESQPKKKYSRDRHTLFVGNLPFDTADTEIRDLFGEYGKVQLVTIPKDRNSGRSRGFAFVDMGTPEELQAAIDAVDSLMFGGRTLRVVKSVPKDQQEPKPVYKKNTVEESGYKKIYVGNIPFTTTKDDLVEYFRSVVESGEIRDVYIPLKKTGEGRGFAFVTVKEEEMDAAIDATNGQEYEGRKMVVNVPLPPGEKSERSKRNEGTKLYVGNLSFYTVTETLVEMFEEFGTVRDCYLPEDREKGGTRGFGFVTMDSDAALQAIDELDGVELDGRIIRVNEAQPKGSRPQFRDDDPDDGDFGDDGGDFYDDDDAGGDF